MSRKYKIFDSRLPLLENILLIEAESPIAAVRQHIQNKGYDIPLKRLVRKAGKYVLFSAQEVITRADGRLQYKGNQNWYGLK